MASLTVRNLDPGTKQRLREMAALNGNSMEAQVRLILDASVSLGGNEGFQAIAPDSDQLTPSEIRQTSPVVPASTNASLPLVEAAIGNLPARSQQLSTDPVPVQSTALAAQNSDVTTTANGQRHILLIITGGIAAYKSLELIRLMKKAGHQVSVVMSDAATQFISPLSVGALSHGKVYCELFDRDDEQDVGHIRLAREADLIVVAPASADFMAKMANGFADDLPSAVMLAARAPILLAPAMNPAMWANSATTRNVAHLNSNGVDFTGPQSGEMAERGEAGVGRMSEPAQILDHIHTISFAEQRLAGRKILVTAGPTHEPIDPVRYIANRSSGKQGYAIAVALARLGAEVHLVSGPVNLPPPSGVILTRVESARDMHKAVMERLPADGAVMVAAVADWRSASFSSSKIKKDHDKKPSMQLALAENPDILRDVGHHEMRPELVVGFAAETDAVSANARAKLQRKGADWIVANDVTADADGKGVMGGDRNQVHIIGHKGAERWPELDKMQVARRLAEKIAEHFENPGADIDSVRI